MYPTARFTAGNNEITGGFPAEFGGMINLEVLWLYGNQLTGGIPDAVADMTSLVVLDVVGNEMDGLLNPTIGSMVQLLVLNIGNNKFEGTIPQEYTNLVNLQMFNIENCELTGTIPDFSVMEFLTVLRLGGNNLDQGDFPTFIYGMTGLVDLRLNSCGLVGNLGEAIADLTGLTVLSLHDNSLTGAIPDISQLVSMEVLTLHENSFEGPIPNMSGMTGIREVNLSDNTGLFGPIPDFSVFTGVERIEFRSCGLTGTLDGSITEIATLRKYYLEVYRFHYRLILPETQLPFFHPALQNGSISVTTSCRESCPKTGTQRRAWNVCT